MKKLYLLLTFLFLTHFAKAQDPDAFIMTFRQSAPIISIHIPIVEDPTNNYTIDFGDGTVLTNQTGPVTHTYWVGMELYTVTITGTFKRIYFATSPSNIYLHSIEQWGTNQWESMEGAFQNCKNPSSATSENFRFYINATDTPDLSQVTSMKDMFRVSATVFNSSISNWDVSNVTDMEGMFKGAAFGSSQGFNQPLDNWDVSNVTNMKEMFRDCSKFNQPLNNWDVSNVTNMEGMFQSCSKFNQSLNDWDVSNVTNMSRMFSGTKIGGSLNDWDVSNVTNMSGMFSACSTIGTLVTLNDWDVSNVTDMKEMFAGSLISSYFSLENWDVSNVTNMHRMFTGASNVPVSIGNWDVSNVTNMSYMFANISLTSFSSSSFLNNWDVSNVTNMSYMFRKATYFNQSLDNWDVSNVTNMEGMFESASSFNQPLNNWDVSNVTNMSRMFYNPTISQSPPYPAGSFNQPLDNWDVSNVIDMAGMFNRNLSFNQDLSSWNFNENVILTKQLPGGTSFQKLSFINISGLDTSNYDALLLRFAQLELQNKTLEAFGRKYCNVGVRNYLIDELDWYIIGDNLHENCGDNAITGNILYDENNIGCDSNSTPVSNIFIKAEDDIKSSSTLSDNDGNYTLFVYEGTHNVTLVNVPDYFSYSPVNSTISFTGSQNSNTLNFCLTASQTVQDLNITLLPITEARPGFEADYQIIIQNIGTQAVNNISVSLDFDSTMQSFVSAVPSPSSTTTNQLNFDITSLSPFSSTIINFTMQTFTPPTVNSDDILNFTATVSPNTNDYTPNDNTFELAQIVVNSFDPNDKQVLQGSKIYIDDVNGYLHYLIRFQNTGTASAINVRIEEELHESLDWNTIQILNSSHNYRVEITDGNQMEFIFNNINLPYEDEDEEGSNGFIAYKIKPIAGTQIGDFIIGNEAYIYFDYNLPIITNTTSTEVVEETSSVSVHSLKDLISVYPNPTNGILHLSSKENIIIEEVKIYNLQGRELFGSVQHLETISIENLSAGIYLMNIKTNQGVISKKVIKK